MNDEAFRRLHTIVVGMVCAIIGFSIVLRNYLMLFTAIALGLALRFVIERKAEREGIVLEDEMLEHIAVKASDGTLRLTTITLAVIGFALKASGNPMGDILLYICCATLVVYTVIYRYYAWKFGGV